MQYVYLLQHVVTRGIEDVIKTIGIYSSSEMAQKAIDRMKQKPGFRDPEGEFSIDSYEIDMDHWAEGFGPIAD